MPKILDWKTADDPRDVIHLAVQAIVEGHLVAIPTETTYLIATSGISETGAEKMRLVSQACQSPTSPALLVRGLEEVYDYALEFSPTAERIARRAWPGPVKLASPVPADIRQTGSLLNELPPTCQQLLAFDDSQLLTVCSPSHDSIQQIRQLLPGPLITVEACDASGAYVTDVKSIGTDVLLAIDDGPTHYQSAASWVRIEYGTCSLISAGAVDQKNLETMSRFTVVFVCTGNTCRSPLAEKMMERRLSERWHAENGANIPMPIDVTSAGIAAMPGSPASENSQVIARENKLTLDDHRSRPFSEQLLESADLVLTMTGRHRAAIIDRWPQAAEKVFPLSGGNSEIADPFGSPLNVYRQCSTEIGECLDRWVDHIFASGLPHWGKSQPSAQ